MVEDFEVLRQMKDQIINPLIRFRQKAQGRYANRVGGSAYARAVSSDRCFVITDAVMGVAGSNAITICFNKEVNAACSTTGWTFKLNGTPFTNVSLSGVSQPCVIWLADNGTAADAASPTDTITLDYTPGTCGALGESDCALEELTDFPVSNYIYGPAEARVSDSLGDNLIRIFFDVNPATEGTAWEVKVNNVVVNITDTIISNNEIQLTLASSVASTDTVTYTQSATVGTRCTSIDGRTSAWFYDEPVTNAVGTDYWAIVDNSPWMLANGTDTWSVA